MSAKNMVKSDNDLAYCVDCMTFKPVNQFLILNPQDKRGSCLDC